MNMTARDVIFLLVLVLFDSVLAEAYTNKTQILSATVRGALPCVKPERINQRKSEGFGVTDCVTTPTSLTAFLYVFGGKTLPRKTFPALQNLLFQT